MLVGSIGTNYNSYGVSTMYKGEKIYALRTDGSAGFKIIEVTDP